MNFLTPLAPLTLATILGVAAFTGTAGAQTQLADNMVEGGTYTIQVGGQACVADHRTGHLSWVEGETQPLGSSTCGTGTITFTIQPHDGCANHQLDLIRGLPLPVVDATHRYNEFPIGGNTSRLLSAVYVAAADDCGVPAPTTTTTAEVLPPASVPTPPTTITVERSTPIPDPTTTVFVSSGDPITPAPSTTLYVAGPTLPETGMNAGYKALWGCGVIAAGLGMIAGSALCRRRNLKENQW